MKITFNSNSLNKSSTKRMQSLYKYNAFSIYAWQHFQAIFILTHNCLPNFLGKSSKPKLWQ